MTKIESVIESKDSGEITRKADFFDNYQRLDFKKEIADYLKNAITNKNLDDMFESDNEKIKSPHSKNKTKKDI